MIGKRSQIDFSEFTLEVIQEGSTLIHKVRKTNHSHWYAVTFINTQGKMFVTGDYGEWIFNREFHPSEEGQVSDGYWLEKMRTGTSQVVSMYDGDATYKELKELLDNEDNHLNEEEREFIEELMGCAEDEVEYTYKAYRELNAPGRFSDYFDIPFCKKLNAWVPIIFDYFEFVCWKLKESSCLSEKDEVIDKN